MRKSGTAPNSSAQHARTPSGRWRPACPAMWQSPPGCPRGGDRRRGRGAPARRSRRSSRPAAWSPWRLKAMPGRYRHRPCASRPDRGRWGAASACSPASGGCACRCPGRPCRTATRGRSRRATGSCSSTPGRTSRARSPTSSARSTRSACGSSTCGCSSAPTPTPTTAGRRRRSSSARAASCGPIPTSTHFNAAADDPEAAHARRVEIARQSGVPVDAADRGRPLAVRAARARPRPRPRGRGRDRPRPVVGALHAGPRALPRVPVPARAAAADLRRPPAGPRLAVLRLRLDPRPGRRVPRLARRDRGARRAARAERPRPPVHRRPRAPRGQPPARAASASTRSWPASPTARAPPTTCSRRSTARRSGPTVAGWLLSKLLCYLTHLEATGAVRRIEGEPRALGG